MENNDDSDYILEESKDSANSSRPKRHCDSLMKYEDSFQYSNCNTNFTRKGAGRRHKRKSSRPQSTKAFPSIVYQCSLCSFQTDVKCKLKRHFIACSRRPTKTPRYNVTAGAKFRCEYCPFETGALNDLLSHKQSHANLVASGVIECSHCNLTFFTVEECKTHMNLSFLGSPEKNKENRNDYVDASVNENLTIKVEECSNEEQSPALVEEEDISAKEREKVVVVSEKNEENRNDYVDASVNENLIIKVEECSSDEQFPALMEEEDISVKEREKMVEVYGDFDCEQVKQNGLYICPCEKFQTHYRSNYLRHLKLIHNVKRIRPQDTSSINDGGDEKKPLICLKCQRQADSQLQLVVHMALDHVKPGGPLTCLKPGCGFETDHKDELKGHLMDTHNLKESIFHPLTDAYSEGQQVSFTCSKCFHETKNEVYLQAHYLISHLKNSDAPFKCPWSKCLKYLGNKRTLRQHLKGMHGMEVKDGTAVPPDQGWNPDGHLLSCRNCGHKSRTDFQMLIHRTFYHHPRSQHRFGCPLPECLYNTYYKHHLRRHLRRVHKLGEEHFRDYGMNRPKEQFKSDVVQRVDENLDEVSIVDSNYGDKYLSPYTNNGMYNCGLCVFISNKKRVFWRHLSSAHQIRQCDMCEKIVWGKYQWFWHNYSLHKRMKNWEFCSWNLKCGLCRYQGTTKSSYKHGATHQLPRVMFQTFYRNAPSDHVTFHYAEHEDSKIGVGNKAHEEKPRGLKEIEDCVAPSAIKVLDWTKSDEEGDVATTLLPQLDMDEAITIEVVGDSDADADTQSNSGDPNISNPPNYDDDLLIKVSEFLTCKECSFETQDAALLKVHGMVAHLHWKMNQTQEFRCIEDSCRFQSLYLHSLKRHLMRIHNYDQRYLREIKDDDRRVPESGDKHGTGVHASTNPEADHDWNLAPSPEMSADRGRNHGINKFCNPKFICPNFHCLFDTDKKSDLKRHLEVFHKMEEDNVVELEDTVMSMKTVACTECDFQAKDAEEFKRHFRAKHQRPDTQAVTSDRGHTQEPPKLRLKCSHCPFETLLKKAAHRHGTQHYHIPQVIFHKYANNQRRGVLKYRYPNTNLQTSTRCHNGGSRPVDSYKHNMRQRMPNVENNERRRAREENNDETRPLLDKRVTRSPTRRAASPDLRPSKHVKVKGDSRPNKTKNNKISVRKEKKDFVVADTYSDGDQEEAETDVQHTTIDSDWFCALEDDANEVIRIEVIEDADENLVEPVTEVKAATLRIKCKNKGCDYVCHDTDDIQNHAESCAKSLSRQGQSPEKYVVSTCETPLLDKETLQNHIRYEHLINQEAKPMPKTKLIVKRHKTSEKSPGMVSFQCWMCSMNIFTVPALRNHTYWHARELNNFDLKVRYSKYKGDTRSGGTILIKADPAYVLRRGSDEPSHLVRDIRVANTGLEYDPELPVFACTECNFKTNKEPELARHKKLHWSEEKAAAFNAQNIDETLFTKPKSGSRVACATLTV